jgi:predicted RND superfamily exporter protein
MTAYFRFVLRHRLAVVLVCALLTALAGLSLSRAVLSTSLPKLFFGDAPQYRDYQRWVKQFSSDEILVVGYRDPAPLSRASLERLERAVKGVEELPFVSYVFSLLSAQRIWSDRDTLRVERYSRAARDLPGGAGAQRLQEILRTDELYRELLISRDGQHHAVVIEMTVDPQRSGEKVPGMIKKMLAPFEAAGFEDAELRKAGFPAIVGSVIDATSYNLSRLFPISGAVLLVVVLVLFRRLAPAMLAMAVSGLSVTWSMGFAILLDRELNIMVSALPAVILIVAFSDVIHLWNAYLVERDSGKSRQEAILASASDVGRACLLTSATTFVGFLCLSLVPAPAFREMGLVLGFGVGVALLLAMTLTPVALSWMSTSRRADRGKWETRGGTFGRFLDLLARLTSRRPRTIITAFTLLLAASIFGLARFDIETDLSARLAEDNPLRVDQRYFQRHMSGTTTLEVFVKAPGEGGLLDPRVFAGVAALERDLEALPQVDRSLSLVTLLRRMHRVLGGEGPLPNTRQALAQYLLLFEMSGGEDLERMVDFERRTMLLNVRLNDRGVRSTYEVGQQAKRLAARHLGARAEVHPTGLVYLIGWWLERLIEGQRNGLAVSCLVITLMMAIGLRSLRVGLISMLPNLLPLVVLGGYVGLTTDHVDSDIMAIGIMSIGIGVDDTIHFLMRYRLEARRTTDIAEALRRSFAFSGRAIVLTTVVLALGYAPLGLSDYYTVRLMGTLIPLVLTVALLADLLLVPAMVRVGWIRYKPEPEAEPSGVATTDKI